MKSALSFGLTLFISSTITAQVGIGNKNPRGLLDVNNNQSGNTTNALVLPHSTDVTTLINPVTNESSDVSGTIAFDITNDCIKFIKNDGTWSECIIVVDSIGIQIGGDGGVGGDEFCPTPENLTIEGAPTEKICGGRTVQFSSSISADSYAWTASVGAAIDDATSSRPFITFPNDDTNITIGLEATTSTCTPETVTATTVIVDVDLAPNVSIEGFTCKDVEVTDHQDDPLSVRRADIDVFTGITFSVGANSGASSFSWSWAQNPGDFAEIVSGGNTPTATVDFTKSLPAVGTYILQVEMEGLACGTAERRLTIDIRDRSCNCSTQLVEVTSPITGRIWMDRDLGARSRLNGTSPFTDFGCLFEFGRKNDGHANLNWTNESGGTYTNGTSTVQTSDGIATHNKHNTNLWTTLESQIDLWDGVDAPNNPCPQGFRIPTHDEWVAEFRTAFDSNSTWALEGTSADDWFTSRRYGNRSIETASITPTTNTENDGLWFGFWSIGETDANGAMVNGSVYWHVSTTDQWKRTGNTASVLGLYATDGFDGIDWSGFVLPVRCIKD